MNKSKHSDSQIMDRIGKTTEIANITGLTTGAISQWRTNGMPEPWKKYFQTTHPAAFMDGNKK